MASNGNQITEFELQSFVDGRLNLRQRADIEKYLFNNPVTHNQLKEYKLYNEAFHRMYDPVLEENVPGRLLKFDKVRRRRIPWAQAAVIVLSVLVGVVLGWIARGEGILLPVLSDSRTLAMVEDAFTYHAVFTPEVRHPVEVDAGQQQHLVKWLSKRLKTPVRTPDLSSRGFKLLGGRLLSTDKIPAAQFMYENAKGQRVTLFTRLRNQAESPSAFRYATRGGVNGFYWTDGDLTFALIGELARSDISQLAHYVYEDLNK